MTDIDVPDWVLEASARAVAANAGEGYDSIGQFAQEVLKSTQYEALRAALSAWVKNRGVTYFDTRDSSLPTQVDWNHPEPGAKENVYTLRLEKPE